MSKLSLQQDMNGSVTYGIRFAEVNFQALLAANVESTFVVPGQISFTPEQYSPGPTDTITAIFSYEPGTTVWVGVGSTPVTVPAGVFTPTGAQLNPAVRMVKRGDTLRFISNNPTAQVGVSFYE